MSERLDRIEKMLEEIAKSQIKTDAHMLELKEFQKQTETQLAKTDAQLAKTDSKLRQLGFNLGFSTEQLFQIALEKRMTLNNVKYDAIAYNLKKQKGKLQREYDIVMYNGNSIALIEVKHSLKIEDLKKLKEEQLPDFKALFPEYSGYKIYLGAASTHIEKNVKNHAQEEGICLLVHDAKATELNHPSLIAY